MTTDAVRPPGVPASAPPASEATPTTGPGVVGEPEGEPPLPARPSPPPPGRPPDPSAPRPDADVLARVLKAVSAILAPTTVLTGLLFYFGRLHLTGMFRYLGVNLTVLDLTPADYLIRSADGLFVPLAVAASAVLALLWLRSPARRLLDGRRGVAGVVVPVVVVAVVLLALAAGGLGGRPPFGLAPELPGLALAIGVLMLAYAVHVVRLLSGGPPQRGGPDVVAEWAAVFVVVSVGLFWAVGSYAIGVGTGRGEQIERELPATPDTVLYSEKRLNLRAPGVTETDCQGGGLVDGADDAYRFRYDGLKLVLQSGSQYLFLPAGWTRETGPAVLVPRTDAVRLEFSPAGRSEVGAC